MSENLDRRDFLTTSATAGLALGLSALPACAAVKGANEKIVVGCMGTGGRAPALPRPSSDWRTSRSLTSAMSIAAGWRPRRAASARSTGALPRPSPISARILDDNKVDVLVVATCNHWHAPAAILACAAGKHVYVEKPCSHNPREGELLVEAARKHKRHVQMGNQRRSWPQASSRPSRKSATAPSAGPTWPSRGTTTASAARSARAS